MEDKLLNDSNHVSIWNLSGDQAFLQSKTLAGLVDVSKPQLGLHQLQINNQSVAGHLLGIKTTPEERHDAPQEHYSRGDDLVVAYQQSGGQQFGYEVYWRMVNQEQGIIGLEAIVSIQTDLLESFPEFHVVSELGEVEILVASEVSSDLQFRKLEGELQGDDLGLLLVRPRDADWSYVEMTHPEDPNHWQVERKDAGNTTIHRKLGGLFMEKGVIRRMRIRGLMLPREGDQQLAQQCLEGFRSAAPPLTT